MNTITKISKSEQSDPLAPLDLLTIEAEAVVRDSDTIAMAISNQHCLLSRRETDPISEINQRIANLNALELNNGRLDALAARITDGLRPASRGEIGEHVALLLGSFPCSNAPDPAVYTRMMVEEVITAAPSLIPLDAACRSLRRTHRWPPAIAKVLATISVETKSWGHRLDCARHMLRRRTQAVAALMEQRDHMASEEAKRLECLKLQLVALKAELDEVKTKGRQPGSRWPWAIKADIERVQRALGGR